MKTLAYRARSVVREGDGRRKEIEHLRGALKCDGYPDWILLDLRNDNNNEREKEGEISEEVKELPHKERRKFQ